MAWMRNGVLSDTLEYKLNRNNEIKGSVRHVFSMRSRENNMADGVLSTCVEKPPDSTHDLKEIATDIWIGSNIRGADDSKYEPGSEAERCHLSLLLTSV